MDEAASRALGRLVREAWTEGPQAPSPEFLFAAIRPALAEIDRERRGRPSWSRAVDAFLGRLSAVLRPSPAFAAAAAAAFLFMLVLNQRSHTVHVGIMEGNLPNAHQALQHFASTMTLIPVAPLPSRSVSATSALPSPVAAANLSGGLYNITPLQRPAVLYKAADGAMTLWLLDDGDNSNRMAAPGQWG